MPKGQEVAQAVHGRRQFQSLVGASSSDAELDMKLKNAARPRMKPRRRRSCALPGKQSKMEANLNLALKAADMA